MAMAIAKSSIRSTWLLLIILAAIIYQTEASQLNYIACSQPDNFTVQITENQRVVVYGMELLIRYNPHIGVFAYPGTNSVNIAFNESTVTFEAFMLPEKTKVSSPKKLFWYSDGFVLGIGTLQKPSTKYYKLQECHLLLPSNAKSSSNAPQAVQEKIIHYAHSCIETHICKKLGKIKPTEIQDINNSGSNAFLSTASVASSYQDETPANCDSYSRVDLNINAPVNLAVRNAVKFIEEHDQSIIKLPDIQKSYSMGPFTAANFEARNGTFRDLSTLKRTENATISNVGQVHVIQAGFGLSTTRFEYDHYQIKVGLVGINGKIVGSIEGLALAIKMTIYYDEICTAYLNYVKVSEVGELKIDMTGLGPLNNFTSKFLTWLTSIWQDEIVKIIESNLKTVAQEQISKYICNFEDGEKEN